jgi:hypothetical protein
MIKVGAPSHNGFVERSENIIAVTGCKSVGENVAFKHHNQL